MKKMLKNSLLTIFFVIIALIIINNIYNNPSTSYSIRNREWHKYENTYKNLSTDELVKIITIGRVSQKNNLSDLFKPKQYSHIAKKVLASRSDPVAIQKLTEIINNDLEGNKWDVIGEIGRKKNSAMVPSLCKALKKHTFWHTDILIVRALVSIDDPSALQCFIEEKDKIESGDSRRVVEKAIEKWSTEAKK